MPIMESQNFKFMGKIKTQRSLQDGGFKTRTDHIFCLTICLTVSDLGGTCYRGLYPHADRPALSRVVVQRGKMRPIIMSFRFRYDISDRERRLKMFSFKSSYRYFINFYSSSISCLNIFPCFRG